MSNYQDNLLGPVSSKIFNVGKSYRVANLVETWSLFHEAVIRPDSNLSNSTSY